MLHMHASTLEETHAGFCTPSSLRTTTTGLSRGLPAVMAQTCPRLNKVLTIDLILTGPTRSEKEGTAQDRCDNDVWKGRYCLSSKDCYQGKVFRLNGAAWRCELPQTATMLTSRWLYLHLKVKQVLGFAWKKICLPDHHHVNLA